MPFNPLLIGLIQPILKFGKNLNSLMKFPINHFCLLLAADRDCGLEWSWSSENALLDLVKKSREGAICGEADIPAQNSKCQQEFAPSFLDSWLGQNRMPI
jgi:hypothetical protein